jgi:hypothetical protein
MSGTGSTTMYGIGIRGSEFHFIIPLTTVIYFYGLPFTWLLTFSLNPFLFIIYIHYYTYGLLSAVTIAHD